MEHHSPHIVFLFSDTGGGHRSAAEAIIGALEHDYSGQFTWKMVDILRDYAPPPLDRLPDIYLPISRHPELLGKIFQVSDNPQRIRVILNILWPYLRPRLKRLIKESQADLFVSVHPLINLPLGHAFHKFGMETPWVTVVTDLVSAHTSWFTIHAPLIVVPTEDARQVGLKSGIPADRVKVVGLPVSAVFGRRNFDSRTIRLRLGWPPDVPLVLLMGGGEGMGQLEDVAAALDEAALPVTLVIVAGRNKALQQRLEARAWKTPTFVYGFVQEMPDFMHAAYMLLTKAGPGTLSEAINAGLPMILYDRVSGPEDGNVSYIVDHNAGVWAPRPDLVVSNVIRWLDHPDEQRCHVSACLALAHPQAASEIARLIMTQVQGNV